VTLRTYTGEPKEVKGEVKMNVKYHHQEKSLPLVVAGNGPVLLGRNWLPSN